MKGKKINERAFDRLIKLKLIASPENDGYYLPTRDKDDYLNKHTAYIWLRNPEWEYFICGL